jgi:ribosomal protein S18 acetylase RimI-like enzyme
VSGYTIRHLRPGDEALVQAAAVLFDEPPIPEETARFLADPLHYLLIAYLGDAPAGFVTGTRVFHPDKRPEMFLNELGVDEPYRQQGIGRALTKELARIAREAGCAEMWVLTSPDNTAAMNTYRSADGTPGDEQQVMFTYHLHDEASGTND